MFSYSILNSFSNLTRAFDANHSSSYGTPYNLLSTLIFFLWILPKTSLLNFKEASRILLSFPIIELACLLHVLHTKSSKEGCLAKHPRNRKDGCDGHLPWYHIWLIEALIKIDTRPILHSTSPKALSRRFSWTLRPLCFLSHVNLGQLHQDQWSCNHPSCPVCASLEL